MSTRITLRKFQSFDDTGAGVEEVRRINVIVGPNNAGKSKVLRAIDRTLTDHTSSLIREANATYEIEIDRPLSETEMRAMFPHGIHNQVLGGDYWDDLGTHLMGTRVTVLVTPEKSFQLAEVHPYLDNVPSHKRHAAGSHAVERIKNILNSAKFARFSAPVYYIAAERDVVSEDESNDENIRSNGTGVTNLLRQLMYTVGKPKHKVEVAILSDLNAILSPDHHFDRIHLQQHPQSKKWEIFLEESGKGLVPLSQCGSGLRTLIHLLTLTNVVGDRNDKKIKQGTFLFEELENCLHPHVQRNLFAYLDALIESPAKVFMTTHSSVCLDYFQGHDDVVLTHLFQSESKTRSRLIEAFEDRCGVLDRMGSRASEALQSNAVIWVEGPSDRSYLKHWFELCEANLTEGRHYSIMFYGGDLLAHLTMSDEEEVDEYIRLLRINRNSAIIIDSDKRHQAAQVRETKRRVKEEAEKLGRVAWITKGKEIENYLAPGFLQRTFSAPPNISNYEPPWDKLKGLKPVDANKAIQTKVEFAELVRKSATASDFHLDWRERTQEMIAFVRGANGL